MVSELIGRYQIKEELGKGGMATVYRAVDPRFEREVAVKVLPRAFLHDALFRARFEREAKTVAALEHGAIVPVYDFGEEEGQPYIVMRLMSGGSLGDKLKKGRFSMAEAVQVLAQLGPALDAAHNHGVVHRDMKPGNILFDQYGNAYLSDFGIARLTESSHTLTGENVLGTPAYMSPEQVQGDKDIDGRCDQYALGIIFYQMLVGHVPYQATTPAKVMMMHILEPVPDISTVKPEVPPMVKVWFTKVLAKDPDDRFDNIAEMVEALEAAVQGQKHPTLIGTPTKVRTSPDKAGATIVRQAPSVEAKPKRNKKPLLIGAFVLGGLAVAVVLVMGLFGLSGKGPLAMLSQASPTESAFVSVVTPTSEATVMQVANTDVEPSPSPNPPTMTLSPAAATETEPTSEPAATTAVAATATSAPEIASQGGAAQVAFLNDNDIWLMNLDGSDLEQLTFDGAQKHDLSWHPNGDTLYYISGTCIWSLEVESKRVDYLSCLETAKSLDAFRISPDGEQVAISLNTELYLIPFDTEVLRQARYSTHLQDMSKCDAFDPWEITPGEPEIVKDVHWSQDGAYLSVMIMSPVGGIQGDAVRVLEIDNCDQRPNRVDEFPAGRFSIDNYSSSPYLQNFAYNGSYLYAVTSFIRNDGYGDLYTYNADLHTGDEKVNPINGKCCYRDPEFSPDGRYLIFAYQPLETSGNAQLYYISYFTLGTGTHYEPLPVPENFFSNSRAWIEPALRPLGGE